MAATDGPAPGFEPWDLDGIETLLRTSAWRRSLVCGWEGRPGAFPDLFFAPVHLRRVLLPFGYNAFDANLRYHAYLRQRAPNVIFYIRVMVDGEDEP